MDRQTDEDLVPEVPLVLPDVAARPHAVAHPVQPLPGEAWQEALPVVAEADRKRLAGDRQE